MDNCLNNLSGIEFERLCQALLRKLGFEVEMTKQSGDGGIDLIAYNHQSFYSGKYMIQCKRYTGSVGEPIVRDLYGVVMSEHANKGILITTGHFTISATRFAQNKNLELIDGETLTTILVAQDMIEGSGVSQLGHFSQYACFDKKKYEFYKSMVTQNMCSCEMGHDFLFEFLFGYFSIPDKSDEVKDMIHSGLAEEFLKVFEWYTGKYLKKSKENQKKLEVYIHRYKGVAQLYNFDLFEYVQERYVLLTQNLAWGKFSIDFRTDNGFDRNGRKRFSRFYLMDWNEEYYQEEKNYIIQNLDNEERVIFSEDSDLYEVLNLLSLFHYFEIKAGIDYINEILYGCFPELALWVQNQQVYREAVSSCLITYKENGEEDYRINLTAYYDRFKAADMDRVSFEIEKINDLLSSL